MSNYEFNSYEKKVINRFVEILRPDLTLNIIKTAIKNSNIDPYEAIQCISEQIEAVEEKMEN
jgi:hypothetical protein